MFRFGFDASAQRRANQQRRSQLRMMGMTEAAAEMAASAAMKRWRVTRPAGDTRFIRKLNA